MVASRSGSGPLTFFERMNALKEGKDVERSHDQGVGHFPLTEKIGSASVSSSIPGVISPNEVGGRNTDGYNLHPRPDFKYSKPASSEDSAPRSNAHGIKPAHDNYVKSISPAPAMPSFGHIAADGFKPDTPADSGTFAYHYPKTGTYDNPTDLNRGDKYSQNPAFTPGIAQGLFVPPDHSKSKRIMIEKPHETSMQVPQVMVNEHTTPLHNLSTASSSVISSKEREEPGSSPYDSLSAFADLVKPLKGDHKVTTPNDGGSSAPLLSASWLSPMPPVLSGHWGTTLADKPCPAPPIFHADVLDKKNKLTFEATSEQSLPISNTANKESPKVVIRSLFNLSAILPRDRCDSGANRDSKEKLKQMEWRIEQLENEVNIRGHGGRPFPLLVETTLGQIFAVEVVAHMKLWEVLHTLRWAIKDNTLSGIFEHNGRALDMLKYIGEYDIKCGNMIRFIKEKPVPIDEDIK